MAREQVLVLVEVGDPDTPLPAGLAPDPAVRGADLVVAFDQRRRFGRVHKWRHGSTEDWMVQVYGHPVFDDREVVRRNEELAEHARLLLVQLEGAWWLHAADAYGRLRELTGLGPAPVPVPPIDPGRWAGGGGS